MKQLTCEMCGGTDLMKQDGVFVCQNCGMKYSVEDAQKMMIEGTVDVQGTVKIDNSDFVEKYLRNARRARTKEAWNEVEKYYNLVEQNDPDNIEAIFYSAYAAVKVARAAGGRENISLAQKSFMNCYAFIKEEYDRADPQEFETFARQVFEDVIKLSTTRIEGEDGWLYCNSRVELVHAFANIIEECYNKRESLALLRILVDSYNDICDAWKWGKMLVGLSFIYYGHGRIFKEKYATLQSKLKQKDPSYVNEKASQKSGCYVATAVYGSYDCPEVWTLRRYRDYTLAETWYGRAFIKTYYAISPTLVKWFGHTEWFKKMWQGKLDRMVAQLQANGVESTPYEDKKW